MTSKTFIPGKDAPLEDSIARMQTRLQALGYDIEEASWLNPAPNCWSVHIRDKNCPQLFTNGKGRNRKAALASALGEFFERLTTLYFFADYFYGTEQKASAFSHHEDERWFEAADQWPEGLLDDQQLREFYDPDGELLSRHLIDFNTGNSEKGICALPYRRLSDGERIYFPVNVIGNLYVSNGMSAGNTVHEARVQALAEILERAIKFRIIREGLSLPDIPIEVVARYPHIEAAVEALREHGFSVLLKDASLGGRYPVINVTLLNSEDASCFASFGAHPKFEVALERTVTELLQGRDLNQLKGFSRPSFDTDEVADPLNLETHFIDSSGLIHWSFFSETADYTFSDWNFEGDTLEEFEHLFRIIHDDGYEIFCRDDDRLGVPTCRIVVPGLSEIYSPADLVWDNNNAAISLRMDILQLAQLDSAQRAKLAASIEREGFDPQQPVAQLIGVVPAPESKWAELRVGELQLWLALDAGDFETALEHLDWVIAYGQLPEPTLHQYRCLMDRLQMEIDGYASKEYRPSLTQLYGAATIDACERMLAGEISYEQLAPPHQAAPHIRLLEALEKAQT